MAEMKHSGATGADYPLPRTDADAREMTINLRPYGWRMWDYMGTRAQLEGEGVIPAGTEWPAAGARASDRWAVWTSGNLRFSLCRTRPEGLKGPMRLWVNGDWWRLRCETINAPGDAEQKVIDAKRALDRERYLKTPAGHREWVTSIERHWAARRDEAFLAFKLKIPGLVPAKGGRKSKALHASAPHAPSRSGPASGPEAPPAAKVAPKPSPRQAEFNALMLSLIRNIAEESRGMPAAQAERHITRRVGELIKVWTPISAELAAAVEPWMLSEIRRLRLLQ